MNRRRYLKTLVGKQIVVNTKDDQSIRGVLTVVADDVLVLEAAELLGKDVVQIAGRVDVPRDNYAWSQEL